MTRMNLLLACSMAALVHPSVADAQTFSGELRCRVGQGAAPLVGAYRALDCDYIRQSQITESYSGYTGIIGVDPETSVPQILAFRVFSNVPKSFAELQGRYSLSSFTASDQTGRPLIANALRGGRDDGVYLRPVPSTATPLTIPNAALGLAQIQLNYRGEIGSLQRSQGDD